MLILLIGSYKLLEPSGNYSFFFFLPFSPLPFLSSCDCSPRLAEKTRPVKCDMDPQMVGFGSQITKKQTRDEGKRASVQEEMKRMNRLPANSNYANHRLRVLNKILKLLSSQRTTSQDEELELLFAGLQI